MIKSLETLSPISILENGTQNIKTEPKKDFFTILSASLNEVNKIQKKGENALGAIASGQVKDLHQAAIAIDKAELNMKVMLEVRNKALNAYKEILRTQL